MWISTKSKDSTKQRIHAGGLLVFSFILSLALRSPAQSYFTQTYTLKIANDIEAQKKNFLFPKVVVIDFPVSVTGMENLSSYLADDLSHALEMRLPPGTVIPRAQLRDFLQAHRLSPSDLTSISVASWAADKLGANEILVGALISAGEVVSAEDSIDLNLKLVRLGDAKEAASWKLVIPLTDELKSRKGKKLDWQEPPDPLNVAPGCVSEEETSAKEAFTEAGGALPKLTYGPNPPYSEEARKQKLQGERRYDVFIDETGHPVLIIPHRPIVPAFDDITMDTIKKWKFQSATMKGKPVPICVVMEVKWRLY